MIDGKLDPEEWDELASGDGMTSFLQYEPGKYHIAAKLPAGQDLVVSFDLKSDGWLIGNDNLEVRIHMQDGKPELHVRRLEGRKSGPEWVEASGFILSSTVAAIADASGEVFEATLVDPGTGLIDPKPGQKPSVRFDAIAPETTLADAFVPRALSPIQLVTERETALPEAMKWGVEARNRMIVPDESTRIRLTFNGTNDLGAKRVAMRGEGYAKDFVNVVEKPFPGFDNKKRAFVDYDTQIHKDAPVGYRLLRSTLTFDKGPESVLQTSFRVAPLVDLDLMDSDIKASELPQDARLVFTIRSNSARSVRGAFKLTLPSEFTVKSDAQGGFSIPDFHGTLRRVVPVIIPRVTAGTYPIPYSIQVKNKVITGTAFVTVTPKKL